MRPVKILFAGIAVIGLWACQREGPAERLGEEVDEAVENIREGGETLGNQLDDAADDVRKRAEDAREEVAGE